MVDVTRPKDRNEDVPESTHTQFGATTIADPAHESLDGTGGLSSLIVATVSE